MRKSKLCAVLTAATIAMTMAVPTVMPANVTVEAVENATVTEGSCGDNAKYSYDASTQTITIHGTGDMWDNVKLDKNFEKAAKIIIEKGITSIGSSSFNSLTNIEKVEIADTVTTIKSEAFGSINGTITIPASVTKVESWAIGFAKKIVVQGDMKNYQQGAFGMGTNEIEIGGKAVTLGYALAAIDVEELNGTDGFAVTTSKNNTKCKVQKGYLMSSDGKTVYYYASNKTKVTIPDTVQIIKPAAFCNKHLKSVKLGKNVKTIGEYAFASTDLSKLVLNKKLKTIGRRAFIGTKIKTVKLKSNVKIQPGAFGLYNKYSYVKINTTKGFKCAKTVVSSAMYGQKKIQINFCKVSGAMGYQVQIKKGNQKYKYFVTKNTITVKTPKALKKNYNVKFPYGMGLYSDKIKKSAACVSVRPYKISNNKKVYGKWSSETIISK